MRNKYSPLKILVLAEFLALVAVIAIGFASGRAVEAVNQVLSQFSSL